MQRAAISVLVVGAIVAAALAGAADARAPGVATYAYGLHGQAPQIALRLGQAPSGFTGGPITAADGETVNVFAEDALLAADPNTNQHWADVLAGLLHGPELAKLTLYVATFDRVQRVCGQRALGCYSGDRIVAIGQDLSGVTAQSVVTHEYGHHIADNRVNDPWPAVDWGTKRWASYENVCAKSTTGDLFPGDEGQFYQLNPGELFAEDYRVLNERRAGLPEAPWEVVDPSLYPDQAALDFLAQDVTDPWTADTTTTYTGTMTAKATGRGFRVATPYDGSFTVTLTSPASARFALRVVDLAAAQPLAYSPGVQRVQSLQVSVCGQRSVQVQVRRVRGSGSFTLAVGKP